MSAIAKVGVCGAGAMGSGIAQVAAQAGLQVVVYDVSAPSRERSQAQIGKSFEQLVARGKLDRDAAQALHGAIAWTDDIAGLADCDIVIEAIIENFAAKMALFGELEALLGEAAILASNTSSLSIARLARGLHRPERFVGMHFFNPATAMKLVEVVAGPATAPGIAARTCELARRWGKVAVTVRDVPGFIVNRVARPFYAEAFRCLEQDGARPEVIDHLFRAAAGFRIGPLELTDLIGQDVNFAVARSVCESYFGQTRFTPQLAQSALVDANWLGRKTGRGVYVYGDGQGVPEARPLAAEPLPQAPARPTAVGPDLQPIEIDGVLLRISRGLTARAEHRDSGRPVAVIDWFEPATASAAGFAACGDESAAIAARVLAAWGLQPFRIADRPGLIVLRTLAQIANAAGDAILEGVSDASGIDDALRFGANYPFGPAEWAGRIGAAPLCDVLSALAQGTGQPMYNPSQYWTFQA